MRKADLVTAISDKTGVPKVDVLVTLEEFFKEVKSSLSDGENVYIRGFGSFKVVKRAQRVARNPKTNVEVIVPEQYVPVLKISKDFKEAVNSSVSV